MSKISLRHAFCASLIAIGFAGTTVSAAPLNGGLGQAWPNARDVSANGHWHVYVFANNGMRYIQVNDANGSVRLAFGTASGQFLVLPMGRDAQHVSTPQQSLPADATAVPLTSYTETVYRDDDIQVDAVPMSDGTTHFSIAPMTATSLVSPCDNPAECNGHLK